MGNSKAHFLEKKMKIPLDNEPRILYSGHMIKRHKHIRRRSSNGLGKQTFNLCNMDSTSIRRANSCQALTDRFLWMASEGLIDIRFVLSDLNRATKEQVCREVEYVYEALDAHQCVPLDFQDSYRSDKIT